MRCEEIKERNDVDFKRLTGVTHQTFRHMVAVLEKAMLILDVRQNCAGRIKC